MNIEIYEDTYNIAVNQYLSRKTAGSKRRKEAFRSKKRRSRVPECRSPYHPRAFCEIVRSSSASVPQGCSRR